MPEDGEVLTLEAFFENATHVVPFSTTQGVPCAMFEGTESIPVFGFVQALGQVI